MKKLILLSLSLAAMPAFAAGGNTLASVAQEAKTACASDIKKHCGDVTPGEGRISSCLSSKADQLSESCNAARLKLSTLTSKKIDKATVAFRKDCGKDVQKFCKETPPGQGRLLDCLGQHEESLSGSCKGFAKKLNKAVEREMQTG